MKFALGRKIGMSQIFDKDGRNIPVTLIEIPSCEVLDIKEKEKSGYEAIQVGLDRIPEKKIKKNQKAKPFRIIKEFRGIKEGIKTGDKIDVSVFQEGDRLKISGKSKGKGFQGGVKKWGFSGRNATHGVKHEHRTIGSSGSTTPERVIKGKKMPGHMGAARITVWYLKVAKIDPENGILAVKGAVPGAKNSLLEITGK